LGCFWTPELADCTPKNQIGGVARGQKIASKNNFFIKSANLFTKDTNLAILPRLPHGFKVRALKKDRDWPKIHPWPEASGFHFWVPFCLSFSFLSSFASHFREQSLAPSVGRSGSFWGPFGPKIEPFGAQNAPKVPQILIKKDHQNRVLFQTAFWRDSGTLSPWKTCETTVRYA